MNTSSGPRLRHPRRSTTMGACLDAYEEAASGHGFPPPKNIGIHWSCMIRWALHSMERGRGQVRVCESVAYVHNPLGHSSIKITGDTCRHLVPGANKGDVDRLDELIKRN